MSRPAAATASGKARRAGAPPASMVQMAAVLAGLAVLMLLVSQAVTSSKEPHVEALGQERPEAAAAAPPVPPLHGKVRHGPHAGARDSSLDEYVDAVDAWLPRDDALEDRTFYIEPRANLDGGSLYRRLLVAAGWVEVPLPRAARGRGMVFLGRGGSEPAKRFRFPRGHRGLPLINHTPGDRALVTKANFAMQMAERMRRTGCPDGSLHPLTFLLHQPGECERVVEMIANTPSRDRARRAWFLKIVDGSLGKGIEAVTLNELSSLQFGGRKGKERLVGPGESPEEACARVKPLFGQKGRLLQLAVPRPLLLDGRKFDLRVYMLVASTEPRTAVYYHRGYARLSMVPFVNYDEDADVGASRLRETTITNTAVQSMAEDYDMGRHLWTMDGRVREEGVRLYGEERWNEATGPRLKHALAEVYQALRPGMNRGPGLWTLYGVDVMMDQDLNVFVIEANTNPSLYAQPRTAGPLVDFFWSLSAETLDVVREANTPGVQLPLKSAKNFELVYSQEPGEKPWVVRSGCVNGGGRGAAK